METIINITLGGRSIAIADTANVKLQNYIQSLRQYFSNEEGKDEIISDIEARFSELMNEKIKNGASHISDTDVDEMIGVIGRPEDFDKSDTKTGAEQPGGGFYTEKKRLYRDTNNKVLGGVCSGIANWLKMDPTVVRILFAIISFGGFGTGVLIYVALWIFLPQKALDGYGGKRMYRNPDDKWFGGVASGIAAYFNTNVAIIRCIFGIPLLLSIVKGTKIMNGLNDFDVFPNMLFNGFSGTLIFVYIVLWIVLPEAKTPQQQLEMFGRNTDGTRIKENLKANMGNFNERIQNWGNEVKESAERLGTQAGGYATNKGQNFGREFGYAAQRTGVGIGQVIGTLFKVVFGIIGAIIALTLFATLLTALFSGFEWSSFNNFLWTSESQQWLGWGTILFFIGAPVAGVFIWFFRRILNIRTPGNYLRWMFSGLWTIGWICLMFFMASFSNDFKKSESVEESVVMQQPKNDLLVLKVSQPKLEYEGNFGWLNENQNSIRGFSMTNDTIKIATVKVEFQKSEDSLYHITITKKAIGNNSAEALKRAQNMQYKIFVTDSVADLQNGIAIDKSSKFRFQNVKVTVKVPVGKQIKVDPSVFRKLINANFVFTGRDNREVELINQDRNYRSNVVYFMEEDGSLKAEDEDEMNDTFMDDNSDGDDNYRWKGINGDVIPPPLPPAAPALPNPPVINDTSKTYHYNESPSQNKNRDELKKELDQKQKEIDELKKKLEQQ